MKVDKAAYRDVVKVVQDPRFMNIYDVNLQNISKLSNFHSVEFHLVIYPYSRKVRSDDISINPYEEYVDDILQNQRSAYEPIIRNFKKLFGFLISLAILFAFMIFSPGNLISIESVVAYLTGYIIGKEIWEDIEKVLIKITKRWRLRYQDSIYNYELEKDRTLTHYSKIAKMRRYGIETFIAQKMDFIKRSNSETIQLKFQKKDLKGLKNNSAHILSIHISPEKLKHFKDKKYLLGIKVCINKKLLFLKRTRELFQSIEKGEKGCLLPNGKWVEGSVFVRNTSNIGRLKFYLSKKVEKNTSLIKMGFR